VNPVTLELGNDGIWRPVEQSATGGLVGHISWRRLAELFSAAGEVQEGEKLVRMVLTDRGITYTVETSQP
jgi:hypothetical protein